MANCCTSTNFYEVHISKGEQVGLCEDNKTLMTAQQQHKKHWCHSVSVSQATSGFCTLTMAGGVWGCFSSHTVPAGQTSNLSDTRSLFWPLQSHSSLMSGFVLAGGHSWIVINWAKTSNAWLWFACLIMDMKQNWYTLVYQHYYSDHICTRERSHISLLHQCASIQYICVWQRQRDPSALCVALVKGRDEMRLNRDGDITSWQAAPGRPWCLDHGHTLIQ